MANEVKFTINITDNGSAKSVTADAEELGKTIESVKQEAEKFTAETVKYSLTYIMPTPVIMTVIQWEIF